MAKRDKSSVAGEDASIYSLFAPARDSASCIGDLSDQAISSVVGPEKHAITAGVRV